MASDEISKLLLQYPTLTLTEDGTHVHDTITGHQMPLKPEIVRAYATSKRYTRLLSMQTSPLYQKYKQFLIDCSNKTRNRSQVYCTLTKDFVNRTHWHIKIHVDGQKFQDAYSRWTADPWPLYGDSDYLTGQQQSSQTDSNDADSESCMTIDEASEKTKSDAAGDDDVDADIDDIINHSHHQDVDDDDKEAHDLDVDDFSDLYPDDDFSKMDTSDTLQQLQSKNPLKRRVKHKKPPTLKDLKAKMPKPDDD